MSVTASMVKELRENTGAGMMDCKKALTETGGDIQAAAELLRKKGSATAEKKAGRVTAEGVIVCQTGDNGAGVLVEVNCETDFVAKDENLQKFAAQVAQCVLDNRPDTVEALGALPLGDSASVENARQDLIAKIGENISVRRFVVQDAPQNGAIGHYVHGHRIGVLVSVVGGNDELNRGLAMHVAASRPQAIDATGISADVIAKEREIFTAQAEASGKPANIVEKMVDGRIGKFLREVTLLGQPYVKDPDQTVEKLLKGEGAGVTAMERFEVGEGIEKRSDDFVAEVMAQAKGA